MRFETIENLALGITAAFSLVLGGVVVMSIVLVLDLLAQFPAMQLLALK